MRLTAQEEIKLRLLAPNNVIGIYNHNRFFKFFMENKEWNTLDLVRFMQTDCTPVFLTYHTSTLEPHEWWELREHGMLFSPNTFVDKLAKAFTPEEMEKRKLLTLGSLGN